MTGPGRIVRVVAITETPHGMRSDATGDRARWVADGGGLGGGAWISTALAGRRLTRDQARASLVLAELEFAGYADSPNARQLREQLGTGA